MIAVMARVDDREGWRRNVAGLAEWYRGLSDASEGAHVIERDGVVASVIPVVPNRSVVNGVIYQDLAGLESVYDELAATYENAWTVWVPDYDTETAEFLAGRGHVLDADPEAMVIDLDVVERPEPPPGYEVPNEPGKLWPINDEAYGLDGEFTRALEGMSARPGLFTYLAGTGSGLCVLDVEDDCTFWLVATVPAARGQGLSTALMAHALADARERGRSTSTLQATDLGRPVYERLGYRSLGEIQMWEKRIR
jgi:GNAT superfamily N-acetyltransferase